MGVLHEPAPIVKDPGVPGRPWTFHCEPDGAGDDGRETSRRQWGNRGRTFYSSGGLAGPSMAQNAFGTETNGNLMES